MNDPRIRELLDRAADLAGDDFARPTASQFVQQRQARRRAVSVTVASVAVIAVIVGLGAALGRERSSSPTDRHLTSTPPSPAPVTAAQLTKYTWSALPPAPIPARSEAASVWTGREMIVWGGWTDNHVYADGAAYNPSTHHWSTLPAAPLTGRSNPFLVWTGRQMLVWGGDTAGGEQLSDGAIYDPTSGRWTKMAAAPLPAPRNHQYGNGPYAAREFSWAGDNAVLVALDKGFAATADVAAMFDPATNSWRKVPPVPVTPVNNYTGVTAALVNGRFAVWISSGGAFTLNANGTGWTPAPYAPKAAGCIYQVIPAGHSIIYPGSQYSVNCGGDLAYIPGVRGSDLDLTSGQVRPIPYTSTTDGSGATVWTGAALLNADAGQVNDPYHVTKRENVSGTTLAWNTRATTWAPLARAPAVDPTATWVWTGTQLIGWGTFKTTSRDQRPSTGLAFAP